MKELKPFKIHASQCSKIMGAGKGITENQLKELNQLNQRKLDFEAGKDGARALTDRMQEKLVELIEKRDMPVIDTLSDGVKSFCQQWLKEQLYGRRKEFTSKYTDKGKIMEDSGNDIIADKLGLGFVAQNEEVFWNDYMVGTPDLILPNFIADQKNAWDWSTFPAMDKEPPKDYYWQGQVYMELCDRDLFKLIYLLQDTPEYLIRREASYYARNNGLEFDAEILSEFTDRMTYQNIKSRSYDGKELSIDALKWKQWDFEKNKEDIQKIKDRVMECREYIEFLIKTYFQ